MKNDPCRDLRNINNLRIRRVLAAVTQAELALMSGVNQSRISALENGLRRPTSVEASKLSKALAIAPGELFPM